MRQALRRDCGQDLNIVEAGQHQLDRGVADIRVARGERVAIDQVKCCVRGIFKPQFLRQRQGYLGRGQGCAEMGQSHRVVLRVSGQFLHRAVGLVLRSHDDKRVGQENAQGIKRVRRQLGDPQ